jgi:outer membrane protein assembly factor BamA
MDRLRAPRTPTASGLRGQAGSAHGGTEALPTICAYFLGGENQIRSPDLRTVGPINDQNKLIGGNKFVLFNANDYVDVAPQVRALAFHDAGNQFDETKRINLRDLRHVDRLEVRVVRRSSTCRSGSSIRGTRIATRFNLRGIRFAVGTTF